MLILLTSLIHRTESQNVNANFAGGKMTALVGHSGSGNQHY